MPEKGLTLKVLFQAIDEMSGTLGKIGLGFDNMDKFAQAAGRSAKATAAILATSYAASRAGGALVNQVGETAAAAKPLDESLTRLAQIAPAIARVTAAKDALNLVSKYGVASIDQEVDALARATQLFGDYKSAVEAVSAANQLALATHTPVIDALNQIGAMARTTGQSGGQVTDKLAAMWKAAGGSGSLAQIERAWGMAKSHGENLEHFLAVAAEAQKAGISGRSLSTYYEETAKSGKGGDASHWSQGTAAIHALLDKQQADIDAIQKRIAASEGVAASLAATSAAAPTSRSERAARIGEATEAVKGAGILEQKGALDSWIAGIKLFEAELVLGHPSLVTAGEDLKAGTGYLLEWGGKLGAALLAVKGLNAAGAFPAATGWLLKMAKAATEIGEGAAASVALSTPAVVGGLVLAQNAAVRAGALPPESAGGFGAQIAIGKAAWALEDKIVKWWEAKPPKSAPAAAPTTIHITNSPTINVTAPPGATPADTATAVKAALDSHDRELQDKLKREVDRANSRSERADF